MQKPKHSKTDYFFKKEFFKDLHSFTDLEQRIAALPTTKDRGDAFEVFAEAYLATQNITQTEEIWPFESIPNQVLNQFGLNTGNDMGVDGIIKTNLGSYNAYQVKYRTNRPSLTWSELSTFMGLSDHVGERILFTNCDDLPALMNERKGFYCIRGIDLDRLETKDFHAIEKWLEGIKAERIRKSPLPHQQEALSELLKSFETHDRLSAIMPCGTGKTLLALWLTENLKAQNILILVPSLALLRQTLHEWMKETIFENISYLCVCSDATVKNGVDDLIVRQSDLDFPVSTDPNIVNQFIVSKSTGPKIVFSTYQSSKIIGKGVPNDFIFDVAIFDEAHKTAGRQSKFGYALHENNIRIKKRFFITATPRHYNPHKKDAIGEPVKIYSMDDTALYGPVQYSLSFAKAVKHDIICDYKVIVSIITSEMIDAEMLKRGLTPIHDDLIKSKQVANQIALQRAVEEYGVKKIFSFHESVEAAKSFTKNSPEGICTHLSQFSAYHVNGKMPTCAREKEMNQFRAADNAVISNARCLTEGVDLPSVDMVAFLSPRRSFVDIVQAAGRAMRKAPNKKSGYILVPLFVQVAQGEEIETAVPRADFNEVWEILQALQEQDEILADTIEAIAIGIAHVKGFNGGSFSGKLALQGPEISLMQLKDAIATHCVSMVCSSWYGFYGQLLEYKNKIGHTNVTVDENFILGRWVAAQRFFRKKKKLDEKKIGLLDEISFDWDYQKNKSDLLWDVYYEKLVDYKKNNENCNVPRTYSDSKLASWVWIQRQKYKGTYSTDDCHYSNLSDAQIKKLDEIDFAWDRRETGWLFFYELLKEYQDQNGTFTNPLQPIYTDLKSWISSQRKAIRSKTISLERLKLLENIKFPMSGDDQSDAQWFERYEELKKYKEAYGHCNIVYTRGGATPLSKWVKTQRKYYSENKLSPQRIELLNKIELSWKRKNRGTWEDMFERFLSYKDEHGHIEAAKIFMDDKKLAHWISIQKTLRRKRELNETRTIKLNNIGFDWGVSKSPRKYIKPERWETMFDRLLQYKKQVGNCDVPHQWHEDKKLGQWVMLQRSQMRLNRLALHKIERLESIGFNWGSAETMLMEPWDVMYAKLLKYRDMYGHCIVSTESKEHPKLGHWVGQQRQKKRRNLLQQDQIVKLDSIGFVWSFKK